MTVHQLWNRMLALALAALPLALGLWIAVAWLHDAHAMLWAETMEARANLRHYASAMASKPELEAAVLRYGNSGRNYYWSAATEAAATADMQQRLLSIIDTAGVSVRDVQPLPATRSDGRAAVNVHVTLDASAAELLETLYSLESHRPYVFLDRLHIRALGQRARTARAPEQMLQVSFDVLGYFEPTREAVQVRP